MRGIHKIILCIIVFLILIFLPRQRAYSAIDIHYVSTTGSDSGDCSSEENPCKTIQYAQIQTTDGDIIQVSEGIYQELSGTNGLTLNKSV